jgi:predicted  nucleic acid-binding Zn-ribbon protein
MKRSNLLILLAALASQSPAATSLAAEPARPDEHEKQSAQAATAPLRNTVYAYRRLVLPSGADFNRIDPMVGTAAGKYADMIGLSPEQARGPVTLEMKGKGETAEIRVQLNPNTTPADKRRADEFIAKVVDSVEEQLRDAYVQDAGLIRADEDMHSTKRSLDELRSDLRQIEQQIRDRTGRADASVEAIRASVPKLDDEREALKLKVVGAEARQQALASAIDRLAKSAAERSEKDPVAAELEKVVKVKELARERMKKLRENNAVSLSEMEEIEGPIAEANARLLERREAVKQANGGELLSALNRELAMISIDIAEAQARLAATEKVLERYVKVQDLLATSDDLRRERERTEAALQKAQDAFTKAKNAIPEPVLRVTQSGSATADELTRPRSEVPSGANAPANSPPKP